MEIPSYYSIIPANVRYDKTLKASEKLLYGEITALTQKTGKCFATNKYFADLYGVSRETISRWINKLKNKGYIDIETEYRGKQIINRYIKLYQGGIDEKINTLLTKRSIPYCQKDQYPIDEKIKDNNTSINNTSNISSKEEIQQAENFSEKEKKEFGNEEINKMLEFLKKIIGIDEFRELSKARWHARHFVGLTQKIGKEELCRRLNSVLEDDFKRKNSNSIKYLYREIRAFIHSPVVNSKKLGVKIR